MWKFLYEGVVRFIFVLAMSMAVSALLFTIEWFTWGAWLFVSLMLTWKFYLVNDNVSTLASLWGRLFQKLDKLDK